MRNIMIIRARKKSLRVKRSLKNGFKWQMANGKRQRISRIGPFVVVVVALVGLSRRAATIEMNDIVVLSMAVVGPFFSLGVEWKRSRRIVRPLEGWMRIT